MDAQLKAKWVEALRSGEYEQGRNQLKLGSKFCCLGVLFDTQGCKWGYEGSALLDGQTFLAMSTPYGAGVGGLTREQSEKLIGMNDGKGVPGWDGYVPPKSFAEIADYIEKNL